jgi:hypothetical protein
MWKGGGVSRRTKPASAGAGMSEQRTLERSAAAERSEAAEAHKKQKNTLYLTLKVKIKAPS